MPRAPRWCPYQSRRPTKAPSFRWSGIALCPQQKRDPMRLAQSAYQTTASSYAPENEQSFARPWLVDGVRWQLVPPEVGVHMVLLKSEFPKRNHAAGLLAGATGMGDGHCDRWSYGMVQTACRTVALTHPEALALYRRGTRNLGNPRSGRASGSFHSRQRS